MEFYSRIIFLNASTVGTTFILLNSISSRFPNGLGNGSDQVGRNLMDHHKQAGATASVEGFEDKYYIGRRPMGIYIPRFRNINEKRTDYIRGFGMQGGASREGWGSLVKSNGPGRSIERTGASSRRLEYRSRRIWGMFTLSGKSHNTQHTTKR